MKLLIYSRRDNPVIEEVRDAVKNVETLTVQESGHPENLEKEMESCFAGETLLVFVIHGPKDLRLLQEIQPGFMDIRLLIYFACERGDMQDSAFQCYPRLICGPERDDVHILASAAKSILEKMERDMPVSQAPDHSKENTK